MLDGRMWSLMDRHQEMKVNPNWIEAIQVKLSGDKASDYDIYYRSHVAEWLA